MKQNKIKETMVWAIVIAVILAVGLITTTIALINTSIELDKQRAIIDMACRYSGNNASCKAGLKLIENMDTSDIKELGR